MTAIDHELMQSLEYTGPYACRYSCADCRHFASESKTCAMLANPAIKISAKNNVCRLFDARIKNPLAPPFNFDDYLEFLGSDYYRPWSVDRSQVIGKVWGPIESGFDTQGVWRTKYGWKPRYKSYDKPYCRANFPRCHVYYDKYTFEIDYRLYRELTFYRDGSIHYVVKRWRDSERARKVNEEYNGVFNVEEDAKS